MAQELSTLDASKMIPGLVPGAHMTINNPCNSSSRVWLLLSIFHGQNTHSYKIKINRKKEKGSF